jgi:hypothetical protein
MAQLGRLGLSGRHGIRFESQIKIRSGLSLLDRSATTTAQAVNPDTKTFIGSDGSTILALLQNPKARSARMGSNPRRPRRRA